MNDPLVRRCGDLIEAEVDEELVGLHVDRGICYGFNATATRIWSLLEEPQTVSQLRDRLLEQYDVSPDECDAQLRTLLDELAKDGLVAFEDGASG